MTRKLEDSDIADNIQHIRKTLGLVLLTAIQLDSYDKRNPYERKAAILSMLNGKDQGTEIIKQITSDIDVSIFPEHLFNRNYNDLISLALGSEDKDMLLDILDCLSTCPDDSIVINKEYFAKMATLVRSNPSTRGAKPQDSMLRMLHLQRMAIVAGVLSAGQNHIEGMYDVETVYSNAAYVLDYGQSGHTVRQYCTERKRSEGYPFVTRTLVEKLMEIAFEKRTARRKLRLPTRIECYVSAFNVLYGKEVFWDN